MIVGVEGKIENKGATSLYVDVGGIVYEVFIPLNGSIQESKGERIKLFTTLIVREDSHTLYGFKKREEKELFDRLIKISGVGPKVALAILSTFTPAEFLKIIEQGDSKALQKVPGIGAKSAQRVLLEMDKFELIEDKKIDEDIYKEALLALESLGFKKTQIKKALNQIEATTTSEVIKEALKIIQKM